jgi:hypothetical protein
MRTCQITASFRSFFNIIFPAIVMILRLNHGAVDDCLSVRPKQAVCLSLSIIEFLQYVLYVYVEIPFPTFIHD